MEESTESLVNHEKQCFIGVLQGVLSLFQTVPLGLHVESVKELHMDHTMEVYWRPIGN